MICTNDIFKVFWGYQRAAFFVVRGILALARFKMPLVVFFGGKNMPHEGFFARAATDLSYRFAKNGYAVLSGGGAGLMAAANCGAQKAADEIGDGKLRTLGIGVDDLDESFKNGCGSPFIRAPYFFVRKWLLINYTEAYIIFPGGIGTVDELFEVLNLTKVGTLPIRPIILVGTSFWRPLTEWVRVGISQGYIPERCETMMWVTDDPDDVYKRVTQSIMQNNSK